MRIQLVDGPMDTTPAMSEFVTRKIRAALDRAASVVRDVTVRIFDENGPRKGLDKTCRVRISMAVGAPVFAEAHAHDYYEAIDMALTRAKPVVHRRLARLHDPRRR
jgi:ribosome-associated translation inhibitor RaiA